MGPGARSDPSWAWVRVLEPVGWVTRAYLSPSPWV